MSEEKKVSLPEKRAILRFLSGENNKEIIKLRRAATIFGREKGDIILNDHEISATHCQIQYINHDYHLFDMNSSNGTFCNDQAVVRIKLNSGDRIRIGQTDFLFQLEHADDVQHISTIFQASKEVYPPNEKTSIVDSLIEHERHNSQRWELVITTTYPNRHQEEHCLSQNLVYLGRATSFGLFAEDPELSRRHLMIKANDLGEVFIEDQNSTNGSFLNGKRIQGIHQVKPSDQIRIGSCELRLKTIAR